MDYDNTLKYLVEEYPETFARWLLAQEVGSVEILKTELSLEPIRADAVIFLRLIDRILHLEFQTLPQSKPALSLRMLDYWVRLYRQYECNISQVVIFLKPTNAEEVFIEQFRAENTTHRYRVIRIWECEPEFLLATPGLLPLATLAKTETPETLLGQVARQIDIIEDKEQQKNLSACVQLLAGLKFNETLIKTYFQEEIMRESVIYQKIFTEGLEQGKRSEISLVIRLINRRLGGIKLELQEQLKQLSFAQLEDLGEALLDFNTEEDLVMWLENVK